MALIRIKNKAQFIKCCEDQIELAKLNPPYEKGGVVYGFSEDYTRGAVDALNVVIALLNNSELE